MICPHCGATVTDAGGRCATCHGAFSPVFGDNDSTRVSPAREARAVAPFLSGDAPTVVTPPPSASPAVKPDTGPLAVGEAFGSRYHPIRVLGVGGMGAVYHVWDAELGQAVALKVIRSEATSDLASVREMERRFKQELVLARQVTHKNVVRIHDLGEINGIKYITMPYLDGSDLATVLKKEGKLPVRAALRIVRDVASGLVAAHEAGVVHRDLKPANIMLVNEQAVIMDFGIARSTVAPGVQPSASAPGTPSPMVKFQPASESTMVGTILGTIEYMAPEQARGEAVDQRADIYALGLIFSDLLLGRRKLEGSVFDELKRRIAQMPAPVRTVDSTIPEPIERVISRCVQPDPAARYQTSKELVADLDRLDEAGRPLPIHRVIGMKGMAAVAAVTGVLLAGTWWLARGPAVPVEHEPVSVLISDFQNTTGDQAFDRTLEPMLKLALEGAGFISAHSHSEISRNLGVPSPEKLTEQVAREIAVKQGLGVVVSGSVGRQGNRYNVSMKAVQAVTGDVIVEVSDRASSKDQVLAVTTDLATTVREELGDDTSDSAQRFAMETLSSTSIEVVGQYASAMEALSRSRFEEALRGFSRAVELDSKFGLAYAGMAIAARNLDKQQDAEKYAKEAIKYLDSMTERERYRTRGTFYLLTGDYQQCVKEYGDLVARYKADAAARNNLALCSTQLRNMRGALEEMRQVVRILPNRALYRENLALYASYSGDFKTAEDEVRKMSEPGVFGLLALAFSQIGQGDLKAARETYQAIGKIDALGASYMASGLGDIAIYEGRFADAEKILTEGAAVDVATKDRDRAAAKFAALGYARALRGNTSQAVAAAESALSNSLAVKIRFRAARIFVEAGADKRALGLAAGLAADLQAESQAYAKIIEGEAALKNGDARLAIKVLTEANTLLDTWVGHFALGRAYLEAGAPLQADSEFDRCITRRGEALALFLDEEPTIAFFPSAYYYQGRVRETLNSAGFADSYRAYLAIRGQSKEDSLVSEIRKRAGA